MYLRYTYLVQNRVFSCVAQVKCALAHAAAADPDCNVEWWMHYQIPSLETQNHYMDYLVVQDSKVKPGADDATNKPGKGLFADKDFEQGDFIVGFPGCWVVEELKDGRSPNKKSWNFDIPVGDNWSHMYHLQYATYPSQANNINAGVVGNQQVKLLSYIVYLL